MIHENKIELFNRIYGKYEVSILINDYEIQRECVNKTIEILKGEIERLKQDLKHIDVLEDGGKNGKNNN